MEKTHQTKLVQLKITMGRTQKILDAQKYEAIERHENEVDNCKRAVEAEKIAAEEDLNEIGNWVAEIDEKLANADVEVVRLQRFRDDFRTHCERKAQEEELKYEHESSMGLTKIGHDFGDNSARQSTRQACPT